MVLARKGHNVQVFIDLEYTARRTLTVTGCSKTMMMTNPKPYREWKTLHREGRLVLKTPKPEKEVGAAKLYTLKGVGRVRLCEPQQARQKGRSYKRPELRSNMRPRTEVISDPSSTPDSAKPGIQGKGGQRLAL